VLRDQGQHLVERQVTRFRDARCLVKRALRADLRIAAATAVSGFVRSPKINMVVLTSRSSSPLIFFAVDALGPVEEQRLWRQERRSSGDGTD
jgi:hypothetical protein